MNKDNKKNEWCYTCLLFYVRVVLDVTPPAAPFPLDVVPWAVAVTREGGGEPREVDQGFWPQSLFPHM